MCPTQCTAILVNKPFVSITYRCALTTSIGQGRGGRGGRERKDQIGARQEVVIGKIVEEAGWKERQQERGRTRWT